MDKSWEEVRAANPPDEAEVARRRARLEAELATHPQRLVGYTLALAPNQQRDARVWAAEFVRRVQRDPGLATDENAMLAWFAAAIETGYDSGFDRGLDYEAE